MGLTKRNNQMTRIVFEKEDTTLKCNRIGKHDSGMQSNRKTLQWDAILSLFVDSGHAKAAQESRCGQ